MTIRTPITAFLTALGVIILAVWNSPGHAQIYGRTQQQQNQYGASVNDENGPENVLIILDASDSMNERIGNQTKIDAAKQAVITTLRNLPPNVNVGLRVYGHKTVSSAMAYFNPFVMNNQMCHQSELVVPVAANNRAQIATKLLSIEAVGKTPITYSLQEAVNSDFWGVRGKKTIILISDGRETCAGNPCDLALGMVRSGVNIKINTIGLATHDPVADAQLKCVAVSTKGRFYSTDTAADLARSLQDSTNVQTDVQAKILTH